MNQACFTPQINLSRIHKASCLPAGQTGGALKNNFHVLTGQVVRMNTSTFKSFGLIILFTSLLLIQSFGQNTVSIKFGGYLQTEDVISAIPSPTWNTVIKGNSTGLLDNAGDLTTCFIRSNVAETSLNPVDEVLLKNSIVLNSKDFVSVINVPFDIYDVYVYVCTESNNESTAKFTINHQHKFLKLTKYAWDGHLDESFASDEAMVQTGKDYIVFKGLSGKEFTLWAESKENVGPAAIQIIKSSASGENAVSLNTTKELTNNTFVYPNPAKDDLYIELANDFMGQLTIQTIDIQGKELTSINRIKTDKTFLEKINIGQLASGNYYIIVKYNGKIISLPVIKY
jgi:hypothetical protein